MSELFSTKRINLTVGKRQIDLPAEKALLILILVSAAVLRLAFLSHWSLWTDELYTVLVSKIAALTTTGTSTDQHPPFYYLLIQGILRIGQSETLLRLPSALGGITAVWFMYRTGKLLDRPAFGLMAAALLAFSPLHVWYSREARMYGPATMMWAASIYFYLSLWRRSRRVDVIGLSASLLAGMYTAYPTLALLFGQLALLFPIWRLMNRDGRRLKLWLLAQLLVLIGYLPWLPFWSRQVADASNFDWLGPARDMLGAGLVQPIADFLALLSFDSTLAGTLRLAALGGVLLIGLVWLLYLVLANRPSLKSWLSRQSLWLAGAGFTIFLLLTIIGAVPRGLSVRRQLLIFWLPVVLLAAWAFLELNRGQLATRLRLVPVFLAVSLLLAGWTAFGPPLEDWRGAAGYVTAEAKPEDLLLLPTTGLLAFEYYQYEASPYTGAFPAVLEPDDLPQDGRTWLVLNRHPALQSTSDAVLAWMADQRRLVESHSFSRYIVVYQYDSP